VCGTKGRAARSRKRNADAQGEVGSSGAGVEEHHVREEAERLAKELGADPDDVLRDYYGIAASIARWGTGVGVVRYLAEEFGLSEEEARAALVAERGR